LNIGTLKTALIAISTDVKWNKMAKGMAYLHVEPAEMLEEHRNKIQFIVACKIITMVKCISLYCCII